MITFLKKRQSEGSTIRVRWTLLTMGVIFLTFTIFSYILLNTFQRVMLENQEDDIVELSDELENRLSNHYYPLTENTTGSMWMFPTC